MAIYKRRRLSRGRFRRRYRSGGSRFSRGVKRFKRFVKGVVNRMSETKWAFHNSGVVELDDDIGSGPGGPKVGAGYVTMLNPNIPQGTGMTNRIGRRIKYKYLHVKIHLFLGAASQIVSTPMRVVVFVPLATPPDTDDATFSNFVFDSPFGPNQWMSTVNQKNVRVLFDKTFIISTADTAQTAFRTPSRFFQFGRRIWNNVTFDSATAATPEEPKDQFYLFVKWPEVTGSSQWVGGISTFVRISYKDF